MKKIIFLITLILFSFVSFSQNFARLVNETNEGLLVTLSGKTMYLSPKGTPSVNTKRSFVVYNNTCDIVVYSEKLNKTFNLSLPVENGVVTIKKEYLGYKEKESESDSQNINFVKSEKPEVKEEPSGRFVKIFNLTNYKMYGMTRELRGIIFHPGGIEESESGSKSYFVSKELEIKYKPMEDYFLDKSDNQIVDSALLMRVLNLSSSSMYYIWLPYGDINFNLRYRKDVKIGNRTVPMDLLAVVQRRITKNTSLLIITDDDLEKYSPKGDPVKRRIQNETNKTFILDLDGKKITCSPKVGRKISLSKDFSLPNGAYYLPMSIIYEGQMYEFYFLTILDSRIDRYPKISDWDVSDLQIFNQKPLE
ncbi:hypothetical protein EOL94_03135 [bacterium]|nr:hypothetical protein [bacterium]